MNFSHDGFMLMYKFAGFQKNGDYYGTVTGKAIKKDL